MTFDARERSGRLGAPLEAYLFTMGVQTWAFTSADKAIVMGGNTYAPEAISRGEIDISGEDEQGSLEITVPRTNEIAVAFIPDLPIAPVMLTVYVGHRNETQWRVLWSGEIASCDIKDSTATLTGLPISRAMRRMVPSNTFSSNCKWEWGSQQCGVDITRYVVLADVDSLDGLTITSSAFAAHADGYFTGGWLEGGDGEVHWITKHQGAVVTVMSPFRAITVGTRLMAYPNCQQTIAGCAAFDNLKHYLGCPWTPTRNLFVVGI